MTPVGGYRMPTPGDWHDTLDDINPKARPNRPPQPPPGTPGQPRRKQAVARRSSERVGPGNTYFYWCEHCNYCNTAEEGQRARCANHRKQQAATRKANWREAGEGHLETHMVADDQVALLWRSARILDSARRDYEVALRAGAGPRKKRALDEAIGGVLEAIQRLPRPRTTRGAR